MRKHLKIVLVHDDAMVSETLGMVLRRAGHEVKTAVNAGQGIALVEKQRPDVLISEIVLPGNMDGATSGIVVRRMHPEMRVLLISGSDEATEFVDRAKTAGESFEVLPLPVDPETILDRLEQPLSA